jgi:hypothetical protein
MKTRTLTSHSSSSELIAFIVVLAATLALYGAPVLFYLSRTFDLDVIASGDINQVVWAFYSSQVPPTLPSDYISNYMRLAVMPPGFVATVDALSRFLDPARIFQLISVLSLFFGLLFIFLSTLSLAGPVAALCSLVLTLSIDPVLEMTAGGLPRAVGSALVCMGLFGLLSGRIAVTLIAALLSSLFYYSSLALNLVFAVAQLSIGVFWLRRSASVNMRSLIVCACTIALITAIALIGIQRGHGYGPLLVAGDPLWPEADYGGRFTFDEVFGYRQLGEDVYLIAASGLTGSERVSLFLAMPPGAREALAFLLFVAIFLHHAYLAIRGSTASALISAAAASALVTYALAYLALPYLYVPGRFLYLVAAPLASVALLYSAWLVAGRRWTGVLLATVLVLGLLGGFPTQRAPIAANRKELFSFVSSLPDTAVLAGWPRGVVEEIPLLAHRRIVVGEEVSLAWHRAYLEEMRQRTVAMMAAWLSGGEGTWTKLQHRYGVTHVLVDRAQRLGDLSYYRPYDGWIAEALAQLPEDSRGGAEPGLPAGTRRIFANDEFEIWALPPLSAARPG